MSSESRAEDDENLRITPVQQAAASCTGALITSLFVTPLDVVKIRLQLQQKSMSNCFLYCNGLMDHICSCQPGELQKEWYQRPSHFNGTWDAFFKISKNEGITSLWSGLGPTLVLAVPATIVYFVSYEQLRLKLKAYYNRDNTTEMRQQPYWIPLTSGATARIVSASLVSPLELIRTKMQSQKLSYFEVGVALKALIKQDGIRGLWKGLLPTLMRDVPFSALYWLNYETIKSIFGNNSHPSFMLSFVAGAISGSVAASVTVPFDVVKTHQQIEFGNNTVTGEPVKTRTTAQVFKDIYRQQGIRGLFAGLVPRLIKVAPACAIMISTFEYGKVFFNRLANSGESFKAKEEINLSNLHVHSYKDTTVYEFDTKKTNSEVL